MAQAAARLEIPQVQVARPAARSVGRRRGPCSMFPGILERGRQRKQLAGYRSAQDVGRQTGIRG
ncbi:MAG: hypothetical protein M3285_13325 [Actinomycetota bacterium]|nr:hypothetical protein [Actinomycetota bacterium]